MILSAGAINSSKVLMLPGTRPRKELEKYDIQVIRNISVGRNLQDHAITSGFMIGLNFTSRNENISMIEEDIFNYRMAHGGPLSEIGTLSSCGFTQTFYEHEKGIPDIQFVYLGASREDFLNDPAESLDMNVNPLSYYNAIYVLPLLLSLKRRGFITERNDLL
ncbi:hypothetical protein K0M31_002251 [Melipona bicolor]|uniref:Glucose-methanol-choline oxidoreductase N-terminal domain-containing protein n=1 Tax=Melipona bicolor TaxID=60889 RepID=A0AA40GHB9_9HYME|nr:hypothetical protein K0M31_002251 [Melipona bicolor]